MRLQENKASALAGKILKNPLNIAVLVSAIWHIFWISTISIGTKPVDTGSPRFSKVFFLGPLLSRGLLDISVETRVPTFLEKKFLDTIIEGSKLSYERSKKIFLEEDFAITLDDMVLELVEKSTLGEKAEPEFVYKRTLPGENRLSP